MAKTDITKQTLQGAYGGYAANSADIAFTAADVSNKNQFTCGRKDLILAWNTDPTNPYTVTVNSVADPYGRVKDITAYSLAAGEIAAFGPLAKIGWRQSDGKVYLEASNAAIKFAVISL